MAIQLKWNLKYRLNKLIFRKAYSLLKACRKVFRTGGLFFMLHLFFRFKNQYFIN